MKAIMVSCAAVIALAGIFGLAIVPTPRAAYHSSVGTNPGNVYKVQPGALAPSGSDKLASFSGGCFWGTENAFRKVRGVVATAVGFTGGHTVNPTHEEVCTRTTGHAETVLIEYNPKVVSYTKLLQVFWGGDPESGPDVGSNYRSAIWCFSPDQVREANASVADRQKHSRHPILTQIHNAEPFYLADEHHQQYDEKNGIESCPSG